MIAVNKIKTKNSHFLKYINIYRRKVMSLLTKKIGNFHVNNAFNTNVKVEIKKVLIIRPNHRLGNLLLTTPLIQEIVKTFPDCEIDLLAKGSLAPIVFSEYKNIKKFILLPRKPFNELIKYCRVWFKVKSKSYDLVINAVKGSSSGKLLTDFSKSKYKVFGEIEEENRKNVLDRVHIAKNSIYNLRDYLFKLGFDENLNNIAPLDLKLTKNEISKGKNILKGIVNNNKKTICIFTFATGKKCYSKSWWNDFYKQLKISYIDYNIVEILPIKNVSQIDFEAPTFYSKDIREIGSVIANAKLFIGADSGIMHLASSSRVTTIGLFCATKTTKYKPYDNNSIALNTNNLNSDACMCEINKALFKKRKKN